MSQSNCIKCGNPVSAYEKYCGSCVSTYGLTQDDNWHKRSHDDINLQDELIKDAIHIQVDVAPEQPKKKQVAVRTMINPHFLKPEILKAKGPNLPGGKVYVPKLWRPIRRWFKTKTEAQKYVEAVHARWGTFYDVGIALIQAEKAKVVVE